MVRYRQHFTSNLIIHCEKHTGWVGRGFFIFFISLYVFLFVCNDFLYLFISVIVDDCALCKFVLNFFFFKKKKDSLVQLTSIKDLFKDFLSEIKISNNTENIIKQIQRKRKENLLLFILILLLIQ